MAPRKPKRLKPQGGKPESAASDGAEIVKVGESLQSELKRYHKWIVGGLTVIQPLLVRWFGPLFGSDSELFTKSTAEFYFTVLSQTAPLTISLIIIFVAAPVLLSEGLTGFFFLVPVATFILL